ncbi:MAG TPA: carboxypeptidase regulatory-like domain-containing protein [Vicinamibacterales bacterium]|nr:carboxypeptidase regulatory-like domain-containing protein [Vicinamibacterales bacterium]
MVALLLLTFLQAPAPAQPPAKPAAPVTAPATQPPAKPAAPATQAPRPRPSGGGTTTAILFITDPSGRSVENVTVHFMGPVDREVKSPAGGGTRIEGLRAGTYRVRFTHDKFITFEKEIVWRAGTAAPELSITLNPAPEPPAPPPAPAPAPEPPKPAAASLPPAGTPKSMSLLDFIEKNFISGREPQKENLIGCSGLGQAMLWQIRDPWNGRQHESADGMIYVVAGDGTIRIGDRDHAVTNGSFAVVPRGTPYSISRRGRNPVIVLAVLAGAPCAA